MISADSMQVYRGMDIGSAKVMPEEMQGADHYLIDVLDPEDEFHVVRFQEMAKAALKEIYAKGRFRSWQAEPDFTFRRCCTILILRNRRKIPHSGALCADRKRAGK